MQLDQPQIGHINIVQDGDTVSKAGSSISKAEIMSNQQALEELRSKIGLGKISKTRPGESLLDKVSVVTPNYTNEAAGQASFDKQDKTAMKELK